MQQIKVKVMPRAKENNILGLKDDILRVKITAPPVQGKANDSLIKFLAKEFDIVKSDIRIVRGESSRDKIIEIPDGISFKQRVMFD